MIRLFSVVRVVRMARIALGNMVLCGLIWFREGSGYQIGWIFNPKKFIVDLGNFNRAFWSWNWYKIVTSVFRVCFSTIVLGKIKTRRNLKKALLVIPVYKTGQGAKADEFLERFQTAVDPHPHPSEWTLSLEIMCMHFILFGHHTSSHICNHICHKKLRYNFPKMRGGEWPKAVWNFLWKLIWFGIPTLPLVRFGLAGHSRKKRINWAEKEIWRKKWHKTNLTTDTRSMAKLTC